MYCRLAGLFCLLCGCEIWGALAINYNAYTDIGTITGTIRDIDFKGTRLKYVNYLGIPYTNNNYNTQRFQKLGLHERFTKPYNASEYRESCLQNGEKKLKYETSHDCLFVNIHAPIDSTINPTRKFPVIIYIHGGAFITGAAKDVSPEIITVAGEVIFVTLNYRLGIFGFLNSGNNFARGNYGLWDQQLAIRWVRYNIAAFGGDVNKITLMGHEAGAGSVMLHALYPGNRGLFQRVIAMSGSATSPWVLHGPNVRDIARDLGCYSDSANFTFSDQPLVNCIRYTDATTLLQVQEKYESVLGPTIDGEFLLDHPLRILKATTDNDSLSDAYNFYRSLDVVIGVTDSDGSKALIAMLAEEFKTSEWSFDSIKTREFEDIVIPATLKPVYKNHELFINRTLDTFTRNNIKYSVMFQYTNWTDPRNIHSVQSNLLRLSTDTNFVVPAVTMADAHSYTNYNASTFVYIYSFLPTYLQERPSWVRGSAHGSEILPAFGFPRAMLDRAGIKTEEIKGADFIMSENMLIWITNFATTGYIL